MSVPRRFVGSVGFGLAVAVVLLTGPTRAAPGSVPPPGAFTVQGSATCAGSTQYTQQPSITIFWGQSADAERYTVYRDGSALGTLEEPAYRWAPLSYTDTPLAGGQTYTYRVVATNDGSSVTWSNELTLATPSCTALSVTVTPQEIELGQGSEATFTATPNNLPEPPQPTSVSLDFDDLDLAVGTAVSDQYRTEFGVTFSPSSANQQEHPIIVGPGLPVGNACPDGTSEASSLPNFLAPHSETHVNFGGTGFGGFVATFSPAITRPSLTLISVGGSTVTLTYTLADGTTRVQTVGPNEGAADGACKKNPTSYDGDELITAIRFQSDAPAGSADGVGIDDLAFTRPPAAGPTPSLTWSVFPPSLGQIVPEVDNRAQFKVSASAQPGRHPNAVVATLSYDGASVTDAADVTVAAPLEQLEVTMSAAPASVLSGSSITVTWTATRGRTNAQDWIAMYSVPASGEVQNKNFGQWQWVEDDTRAGGLTSGTRTFVAPAQAGSYVFRYLLGMPPELTWYTHIAQSNPVVVRAGPPPPPPPPSSAISGDIFARGNVSSLKIDSHSVVSAGGTIELDDVLYQVPTYLPGLSGPLSWQVIQAAEQALIDGLIAEQADLLPSPRIEGTFNLNPKKDSPSQLDTAKPEGGVWYFPGDLEIGPTTFRGRGTIIVGGTLRVDAGASGQITYENEATDLLAVLVQNQQNAGVGLDVVRAKSLVGAYYLHRGTLGIGTNQGATETLEATGLFVAERLAFGTDRVAIHYDARVASDPPPGLAPSLVPKTQEVTP